MSVTVNALGKACPFPVVEAMREIGKMTDGGTLEVLVDNETAVGNLKRMAASKNLSSACETREDGTFCVRIEVAACEACGEMTFDAERIVVAVDSAEMGRGDSELGKTLMKGFLYALSQLPKLPQTLIFYNGGATIPVEGSVSLEDLVFMEKAGVEILTCGTCLNFYGLTEKLAVGSVTNMYTIVEKLAGASKVIKP